MGTRRLPWGDAVAIVIMQPPATSAVYRELHPDDFDLSSTTQRLDKAMQRLEAITVLLVQSQLLAGNQSGVKAADLPTSFEQLFEEAKPRKPATVTLLTFDEIDARMGWK